MAIVQLTYWRLGHVGGDYYRNAPGMQSKSPREVRVESDLEARNINFTQGGLWKRQQKKNESGKPTDGNQGKGQGAASSPVEQTSHFAGDESQLAVSGNSEENRVTDVVDQTKQVITAAYETASKTVKDTYDKTSRTVNETYGRVKSYSRENPGTATLIAFGAGIGVAMLLFGSRNPRSRAGRIVPPVINALKDVVSTLLR